MGPGELLSFVFWIWLLPTTTARVLRQIKESEETPQCLVFNLNSLLHVDCSNQRLIQLPEDINYEAQVLLLSDNELDAFPPEIEKFSELQVLDMSNNYLNTQLPSYFENLNKLQTLNLSNNNFAAWADTSRSYNIKRLDLSRNKIANIDETAFSRMPELQYLDLSENKISDLPIRTFADTKSLETLRLGRNFFTSVPNFQSNSLKSLDLSSCQIATIEKNALGGMSSLVEIFLSMNQIEVIPDDFESATLQELDLSYNDINTLTDSTFSSLPHLAVLNLRGNDFKEVWPTSHFASNPFLREIHVKGNRWNCEGFSLNLLLTYEFLTKDPPKIYDKAALICYSPSNVTQMSWQQAYIRTWHPNANATMSYWSFAMFVGVIIGVVVTSCICRCLMHVSESRTTRTPRQTTVVNLNGAPRAAASEESVVLRVPLREEDLPPSYDEALLMPRLRASFHSLPDFVEEEEEEVQNSRQYRRSRSIGDLTAHRPRLHDRRSTRRTLQVHNSNNNENNEC